LASLENELCLQGFGDLEERRNIGQNLSEEAEREGAERKEIEREGKGKS